MLKEKYSSDFTSWQLALFNYAHPILVQQQIYADNHEVDHGMVNKSADNKQTITEQRLE